MSRRDTDDEDESDGGSSTLPSIGEMLVIVARRARLLAGLTLLAAGIAAAYAYSLAPVYEATATVLIDSRAKNVVEMEQVVDRMKTDTPAIESEVEIARSAAIAGRVIDELGLGEDPELSGGGGLLSLFQQALPRRAKTGQEGDPPAKRAAAILPGASDSNVLSAFMARLSASRVRNTYLIEVGFESRDARQAARIANAMARAYIAEQVDSRIKTAELASNWLERRIGELKERVFDAERVVAEFKAKNHIVDTEGYSLDDKELARAMEQLILARAETASAKAKFAQARTLSQAGDGYENVSDVLNSLTIGHLKDELAKSAGSVAELSTRYGKRHPNMQKAEADLKSARVQLANEIKRIVTNLENEYQVALGREDSLSQSMEGLRATAGDVGQATVQLQELQREATAAREIYESFRKRIEETRQQESFQLAESRIVTPAVVPISPSGPKRTRIIAIGGAAGLVLGLALTVLLELMHPSFFKPEKLERELELRHLASIPAATCSPHDLEAGGLSQIRRILVEPQSGFAESVRSIRVALDERRPERGADVVLVVSAMPGEGKTVVASNLAHHYALSGLKTLLVDCDLRKAMLTRSFMPDAPRGLFECLLARSSVRHDIVREAATGLHFLPASSEGAPAVAAAELLASPAMARILAELRPEFDVIVLDCPPVMPVVDARILADLADQILFVYRLGKTPIPLARRALKNLEANADKIAGIVVNGIDPALLEADGSYGAYGEERRTPRFAA